MIKCLYIKQGIIENVYDILHSQGVSGKILYISDDVVDSRYGCKVNPQLDALGKVQTIIIDNNTISFSITLAEKIISEDIDYVVGLGGGKVLDVSKYAAYISKRPFISIPTTLANDGIASPIAVLKTQEGCPKSLGAAVASILILDILIISNSPTQLIKAGIGDTISNFMGLLDWEHACEIKKDVMNGSAFLMSKTALNVLMKTQYNSINIDFIEVLANSIILSGVAMDFAGSSRPVSGSEHLFSHALDLYGDARNLHGIQVALGTISVLKMIGRNYNELLNYLQRFDVDINPANLGITEYDFIRCMQKAPGMRPNRYTYLNELNLSEKYLGAIYHELTEELR